ncbi:hypothetical protein K227x_37420 [Rubripirellula lacrimiformis]|uniref:DUF1552 domain-containing protein n=1 Tax=Rubripirellula lacrimiformis TaxID=1930273 RepID=A0A517NDY9_9BACT|nr:DUF1552 domain-containing protein [Rubripirellula lacrimiformis]QDT05342.1 hypothetical protein K227x_37420 [Rubripirellula lacrimiformis]
MNLHSAKADNNENGIHRRTLLRGVGLALGLPMLESMTPMAKSAFGAAEVASPKRMACVFFPNGAIMPDWNPTGTETDWQLSKTLKPLEPFKQKLNVIRNLAHDNGRANGDGAGDHARGGATFLTAARPVKTSGNIRLGVSVDQVAATQIGSETRLPSIELGLNVNRGSGSCDSGYSCAYSSNISWRNETQPMPKEITPRAAFERMFSSGNTAEQRERNSVRQSILDVVQNDANRIMKKVGQTDRRKLDEYFTSVREIEMRIERAETEDQKAMPDLKVPFGRIEAFREHTQLMYDLMAIAFETDTTRVATFMLDNAGGSRRYTEIGVTEGHHQMSHHRNEEKTVAKISKVDYYLAEQFAYFLEKLDSISDPSGGTLLDQSMVLYGSGLSDGNRHQHGDLPIVLAGGAGGSFQTGRYIQPKEEVPMGNLFMSMLDAMGTPAESIGDSKGRLNELA